MRQAGEFQRQTWLKLASGEVVDRRSGAYINGLREQNSLQYPYEGDQFTVGVFNMAPHANVIEHGHGAFNLAARINWSGGKVRRGKRGPYLIIPFRHMTPAKAGGGATPSRFKRAMPGSVYAIAKQLQKGERLTFKGAARVAQHNQQVKARGRAVGVRGLGPGRPEGHSLGFHPGGRVLAATSPAALRAAHANSRKVNIGGGRHITQYPGHAKSPASIAAGIDLARQGKGDLPSPFRRERSIYEGMVKTGDTGNTRYMTFRVITPASQWIIPAQPARNVAQRVSRDTAAQVRDLLEQAVKRDIERTIGAALGA